MVQGTLFTILAGYLFFSGILWTPIVRYGVRGGRLPVAAVLAADRPRLAAVVLSPGLLILWIPLGFRATCYYYRKAYYRFYFADPPGCAVGEPTVHRPVRDGDEAAVPAPEPPPVLPVPRHSIPLFFLWVDCRAVARSRRADRSPRPRERRLLRQRRAPAGVLAVVQLAAPPGRRPARLLLVHPRPARPVHACGSGSPISTSTTCAGHGSSLISVVAGRPLRPNARARRHHRPGDPLLGRTRMTLAATPARSQVSPARRPGRSAPAGPGCAPRSRPRRPAPTSASCASRCSARPTR